MKRVVWTVVTLGLVFVVGATWIYGQNGHPFTGRSDTGETVHILPTPASVRSPRDTQPTDAPAANRLSVYPPSYGSGDLINHGGPQVQFGEFFAIYYNADVANSPGSQGYATLQAEVRDFVPAYGPSTSGYSESDQDANYSIIAQYGSTSTPITPWLNFADDFVDNQPTGGKISDSSIRSYLAGLFSAKKITPNENTVYGIYFPSGMKITMQGGSSCSSFCGYHGDFSYNGLDIKYAVFPYANCTGCSLPGKAVADMLTIVTSHEIREAMTDPDLNSWYDSSGYEADDKCAWHNLYQTHTKGFWVQPEYSNGTSDQTYPGPGCVVPLGSATATAPDAPTGLSASASGSTINLSWTASAGATSYNVLRSQSSGANYAQVASDVTSTSYSDSVSASGTYYYVVQAVNSIGTSGNSNQASATVGSGSVSAPAAPTNLRVSVPTAKKQLTLSWTASDGATSYNIYRSTDGSSFSSVGSVTTTAATNSQLSSGKTYYYEVTAVNSAGESAPSNIASGTPR